jgi:hypothetical protein
MAPVALRREMGCYSPAYTVPTSITSWRAKTSPHSSAPTKDATRHFPDVVSQGRALRLCHGSIAISCSLQQNQVNTSSSPPLISLSMPQTPNAPQLLQRGGNDGGQPADIMQGNMSPFPFHSASRVTWTRWNRRWFCLAHQRRCSAKPISVAFDIRRRLIVGVCNVSALNCCES